MSGQDERKVSTTVQAAVVDRIPVKEPLKLKTGTTVRITRRKRKFLFSM